VSAGQPRLRPAPRAESGFVNALIARFAGRAVGAQPSNLLRTIARHRWLFRGWLLFAGALLRRGCLPARDRELVILRVAHNCASEYERRHHESIALRVGLSAEEIARVRVGALAPGLPEREAALLQAVDELHEQRTIRDPVYSRLRPLLEDRELIELCMLVGHYEMVAMTIAALGIAPDPIPSRLQPEMARGGAQRGQSTPPGAIANGFAR